MPWSCISGVLPFKSRRKACFDISSTIIVQQNQKDTNLDDFTYKSVFDLDVTKDLNVQIFQTLVTLGLVYNKQHGNSKDVE